MVELVTPAGSGGGDTGVVPDLTISEICLFINNIFVNPEVHDIFIKRIGFTLIRVHRLQTSRVDKDNQNILLNNMKWPIESMFVCLKPVANTAVVAFPNNKSLQTWHRCSKVVDSTQDVAGVASCKLDPIAQAEVAAFLAVAAGGGTAAAQLVLYAGLPRTTAAGAALYALAAGVALEATTAALAAGIGDIIVRNAVQAADQTAFPNVYFTHPTVQGACAQADLRVNQPTISRLSITAHGIDIYKEMPGMFFHSYTPYMYGGHNIRVPEDPGAHMITFCLYPGTYQPSGHVNVSRAREFYLQYWSEGAVDANNPADLVIVASAINFLLISDGSAVLRYST